MYTFCYAYAADNKIQVRGRKVGINNPNVSEEAKDVRKYAYPPASLKFCCTLVALALSKMTSRRIRKPRISRTWRSSPTKRMWFINPLKMVFGLSRVVVAERT